MFIPPSFYTEDKLALKTFKTFFFFKGISCWAIICINVLSIFPAYNESLYLYLTASYLIAEIKAQFTSSTALDVVDTAWNNFVHPVCVCVGLSWLVS